MQQIKEVNVLQVNSNVNLKKKKKAAVVLWLEKYVGIIQWFSMGQMQAIWPAQFLRLVIWGVKVWGTLTWREHHRELRSELAGLLGEMRAGGNREVLLQSWLSSSSHISPLLELTSFSWTRSAALTLSMLSTGIPNPLSSIPVWAEGPPHGSCGVPRPLQISLDRDTQDAPGATLQDASFGSGNYVQLLPIPTSRVGAWPKILQV